MDMQAIMQQAQQFQQKMGQMQEELALKTVSSTVGGGMVSVVVNGKFEVVSLQIEKDAVDPEDTVMLQDLVMAAMNDAMKKAREMSKAEMAKLTGGMGLNIPGLF
ncbi:MAG: YbaB/EbfC family nucleoid-associated protein [Desulfobulbaceae bacterium]|uniref:Nucleoid-associated protein H8E41_13585 n=1 Tax=Candidatus Desulfobia pelagia TaxID=2841692 RepID=A0A8J6NF83_9BACT|nr:YbaB/EbfC family nucleoid-associated protein [Candidatus Desulfobia pelagia]